MKPYLRLVCVIAALALAGGCGKKDKNKDKPADPIGKNKPVVVDAGAPVDKPVVTAPDPAVVARGKYIADLGGCLLCHTGFGPQGPDLAKLGGGGLEIPEKFGTWRSPNITPDLATGIGGWSDADIMAAVREGKRPDGARLLPIMPYPMYHRMGDDDARALVAFLRTLKPVENVVARATDLKLGPVELPKPAGAPMPTEAVAKGEYLATIMHCAMCHTPMTEKGPDMSKAFAGGFEMEVPPMFGTGVLYGANITPDKKTGIGNWTEQQIIDGFTKLVRPDGTPIQGIMQMYAVGWGQMPADDARAVAAYLMSLKPIEHEVPKSTFKPAGPPPGGPPPTEGGSAAPPAGSGPH